MMSEGLEKLCEETRSVVATAVAFIQKERLTFHDRSVEYKGFNDLVSYVDKSSEKLLVDGLLPLIDGAGFVTEESTLNTGLKDWSWVCR